MQILTVADHESKYIWDYFDKERFKDVDLVISCGDLKQKYLSFLVTLINVPLLYVHGNHDERYTVNPPEGCINIDDDIYVHNGVRILGLGGSYRYRKGEFQYTESEMEKRVKKLKKVLKKNNGFDILVTHAPALGLGDGDDLPHKGFQAFVDLLNEYNPSYLLHGHQHLNYSVNAKRQISYKNTTIINAYEYFMFDFEHNGIVREKKKSVFKFTK